MTPRQGEIWWSDGREKRRPVLVVTRTDVIPVLNWIIVAPLTRTIRGIRRRSSSTNAMGFAKRALRRSTISYARR
ncbi:MAG TPA: type II toxin-antitoxin system PemK/MazF family toxin [Gaiella sp.]|nr:type II toxin-antitoxin system PemK/MazF family toxin [Gaiella sp.]